MNLRYHELSETTGYFQTTHSLLPVYHINEKEVIMVDSGEDCIPAFLPLLEQMGIRIRAILNTHLHIDHVGNNQLLQVAQGTMVFASEAQVASMRHFLQHDLPYDVVALPEHQSHLAFDGIRFEILQLPGHTVGHLGFVFPDGLCCLGDAILSTRIVKHARMPYHEDVKGALDTLQHMRSFHYPKYAITHREIIDGDQLQSLIDNNFLLTAKVEDMIVVIAEEQGEVLTEEELIRNVEAVLDISPTYPYREPLLFAIKMHIRHLEENGRLQILH